MSLGRAPNARRMGFDQIVFPVPMDLRTMVHTLLLGQPHGTTEQGSGQYSGILPAHTTLEYVVDVGLTNFPTWMAVFTEPIDIDLSFHSIDINVYATTYGMGNVPRQASYSGARGFKHDVTVLQGLVIQKLVFEFVNDTDTDTVVTFSTAAFLIERSVYDNLIGPVIRAGLKALEDYAAYVRDVLKT